MSDELPKNTYRFWGGIHAKDYQSGVRKELQNEDIKDRWVRAILENAPDKEKLRILDIGTGPGFFTIVLTGLGHDVTGIDVTPNMLSAARENAAIHNVECDFRQMNANSLDFPDGEFDLIISRNVTWTLPDLYDCYREWRRALAPNGKVIVFDSNHYINLFDEDEARKMRKFMRDSIIAGSKEFNESYDFHVRWTYWENCPMIGTPRPQWDGNMLYKLRFTNIKVMGFTADDYDSRGTSGPQFMIVAEKPSFMEECNYIVNEYWSGVSGCESARGYLAMEAGHTKGYVEEICKHIQKGSKILDIGTGSGTVPIAFSEMGYDVIGIDRSQEMIEMANMTASERGMSVEYVQDDAENMSFGNNSFDAVHIRDVIWNSYSPERILSEANRVLKSDGVLIIVDSNCQKDVKKWSSEHPDSEILREARRRNLGLGAYDVIDEYYAKLPLNDIQRPQWDSKIIEQMGMEVTSCDTFADPLLEEDLKELFPDRFMIVARKK